MTGECFPHITKGAVDVIGSTFSFHKFSCMITKSSRRHLHDNAHRAIHDSFVSDGLAIVALAFGRLDNSVSLDSGG